MMIQENVPLAPLTTLKVGGPARYFVEAATTAEVQEAIAFSRKKNLPLFVLGGGSNIVIADAGWRGMVLKIAIEGITSDRAGGFTVGAGEEWDNFVAFAVSQNCAGIECLSGIPGSVGGTPVQNVGAYGQEVSQTIRSVSVLDLKEDKVRELTNSECAFRYRSSIFNTTQRGRYIVLQVSFGLSPSRAPYLEYVDLRTHFAGWNEIPRLAEVREAVLMIRATKGMLIREGDDDCRSVGSFFKNPVLTGEQYEDMVRLAAARNLQVPSYPALESRHKISAAWLVEHSGFCKGFVQGKVGISRKHALALVNRGGASAAEVTALKEQIQDGVRKSWNIQLETEPVFVGF